MSTKKFVLPLILVTSLFFVWAFLHNLNPILVPHLKKALQLTDTQSALVDFPVYLAYCLVAIPAGFFMHRYGYKKGILFGLFLFACGNLLFIPAASDRSYLLFLGALFITASGATFLETVANPYVTLLGDPASSERRLNFAQSFNGIGAVVAPLLGTKFILTGIEHSKEELTTMQAHHQLNAYLQSEADTVKTPYLIFASIVILLGMLFFVSRLPEPGGEGTRDSAKGADGEDAGSGGEGRVAAKDAGRFSFRVFRYSHVKWAVVAQFFYVAAQVGVGSFFIRYSRQVAGIGEKEAGNLWAAIAMVGFMVGRFVGTWLMQYIRPARLLTIYAAINVGLLAIALLTHGRLAVYVVMGVPFFMSIMFPTIFALGIKGLGEETKLASSFIVMSIIGGAFGPLLMGFISDKVHSMQIAYSVPLLCFVIIFFFGKKMGGKEFAGASPAAAS